MSNFTSKFASRKIGPKFSEVINQNTGSQQFKPYLYEDQINLDRLRVYRLNRVIEQLQKNDVGACILFDPINIRYATDSRNMSLFTMHELVRFVFISAGGKVILFDYPKSEHLSGISALLMKFEVSLVGISFLQIILSIKMQNNGQAWFKI